MNVMPVLDLPKDKAIIALWNYRIKYFHHDPDTAILAQVYDKIGGRLSFLNVRPHMYPCFSRLLTLPKRVAKSPDMLKTCNDICQMEKTWFLNKCWILGEPMDDDVMDQQKYAVSLRLSLLT